MIELDRNHTGENSSLRTLMKQNTGMGFSPGCRKTHDEQDPRATAECARGWSDPGVVQPEFCEFSDQEPRVFTKSKRKACTCT